MKDTKVSTGETNEEVEVKIEENPAVKNGGKTEAQTAEEAKPETEAQTAEEVKPETGAETDRQTEQAPANPDELEPATVHESNPQIMDNLSDNLEKQLDHIVGYTQQEESMDSKIDNAIARIIDETVGDIPVQEVSATDIKKYEKEAKKRKKEEERQARRAEKFSDKEDFHAQKLQNKADKKQLREENPEAYAAGKKKRRIIIGSIAGVLLLALLGTYGGFAYHFRDIFFKGTTINGFDCSELTVSQAEELIRRQVEDYAIRVDFRDGTSESIDGTKIAYKYVSDGGVQRIKDEQSPLLWIRGYFSDEAHEVAKGIEYDKEKLQEKYHAMTGVSDASQVEPKDAYVTYQDNGFVIVPEEEGNQIDRDALLTKLNEAVTGSHTELNVEEADVYNHPAVYKDEPKLATECAQLNDLASVNITYVLPQGDKVLDGNVVKEWLNVDEAGNYSISEEERAQHIKDYVGQLADETNTVGTKRPFHATIQGDITVSGGSYGWKIDQKKEIAQLSEEIATHAVNSREPVYSSREVTTENHGFGSTYIEVDLSNQHLWYYIDGALYMQSDFVSGRSSMADRKTPGGLYTLAYKQRDRVLRGRQKEDGTYEYESGVKYWMPFNGGIGFHDASWRGSFGGTIYKYGGSHGCINMPTSKAKTMYEVIDKGTPIIAFY